MLLVMETLVIATLRGREGVVSNCIMGPGLHWMSMSSIVGRGPPNYVQYGTADEQR